MVRLNVSEFWLGYVKSADLLSAGQHDSAELDSTKDEISQLMLEWSGVGHQLLRKHLNIKVAIQIIVGTLNPAIIRNNTLKYTF